jgi:putative transposase
MPAFARVAIPGIPHHVTQRGNYRQDIFTTPHDRLTYLEYVTTAAADYGLEIHGWCLMTNHVDWIVVPQVRDAMANSFRRAHSRFAAYINRQQRRSCGHLWQGRYYSCPLDDSHFGAALVYVERNPVRAGLVKSAWDYQWSSAAAHIGQVSPPSYLRLSAWARSFTIEEWTRLLDQETQPEAAHQLRTTTKQGKPCGNPTFVAETESKTGRNLSLRHVGRPAIAQSAAPESKSLLLAVARANTIG